MSRRRVGAREALLSLSVGAALARLVTSCAGGDPPAVTSPLAPDAASDIEASVVPSPEAATPSPCSAGGWCAVTPPVAGPVSLNGVWGSASNDVWIVGNPDVTLHWDGERFTVGKADTHHSLFGVWGSGQDDVWTFSTGDALWHTSGHRIDDGSDAGWSAYQGVVDGGWPWQGPISAMWGRNANDVWAVGPYVDNLGWPTVWHCDGWHDGILHWVTAPQMPNRPDLPGAYYFNGIWGDANSDIWIVGGGGKVRHTPGWKGEQGEQTTWIGVDSATSYALQAVWGTGKGEVWAAGAGGTVRRFTAQPDGSYLVSSVDFPSTATIRALYGFSADDIWAAGADGMLAHWDGQRWSLENAPVADSSANEIFSIWGANANDVWAVGQNTLLHKGTSALQGTDR